MDTKVSVVKSSVSVCKLMCSCSVSIAWIAAASSRRQIRTITPSVSTRTRFRILPSCNSEARRSGRIAAKLASNCWSAGFVLPRRQFPSFKPICQLLVGHECLFGFVSPDANQRNTQVVRQKPDRVQNDALFTECASQNGMNLIDNQHAHLELPGRDPGTLPQGRDTLVYWQNAAHAHQQFFIKVALTWGWGHLNSDDRQSRSACNVIKA